MLLVFGGRGVLFNITWSRSIQIKEINLRDHKVELSSEYTFFRFRKVSYCTIFLKKKKKKKEIYNEIRMIENSTIKFIKN